MIDWATAALRKTDLKPEISTVIHPAAPTLNSSTWFYTKNNRLVSIAIKRGYFTIEVVDSRGGDVLEVRVKYKKLKLCGWAEFDPSYVPKLEDKVVHSNLKNVPVIELISQESQPGPSYSTDEPVLLFLIRLKMKKVIAYLEFMYHHGDLTLNQYHPQSVLNTHQYLLTSLGYIQLYHRKQNNHATFDGPSMVMLDGVSSIHEFRTAGDNGVRITYTDDRHNDMILAITWHDDTHTIFKYTETVNYDAYFDRQFMILKPVRRASDPYEIYDMESNQLVQKLPFFAGDIIGYDDMYEILLISARGKLYLHGNERSDDVYRHNSAIVKYQWRAWDRTLSVQYRNGDVINILI